MDIAGLLREELQRRDMTPTTLSKGTGISFSTCSEFMRNVREIGTSKASRIATFLGFQLAIPPSEWTDSI